MRALTIHGPWLGAIVLAGRPIEIRRRPPPRAMLGREIALHCAGAWHRGDEAAATALASHGVDVASARGWRGHVVATAQLGGWAKVRVLDVDAEHVVHEIGACVWGRDMVRTEAIRRVHRRWAWDGLPPELQGEERYLWRLFGVRPVAPVGPIRGQLGLWRIGDVSARLVDAGRRWNMAEAQRLLDPLSWLIGEPRRSEWVIRWGDMVRCNVASLRGEVRGAGLRLFWTTTVEELCWQLLRAVADVLGAGAELEAGIAAAAAAGRYRSGLFEMPSDGSVAPFDAADEAPDAEVGVGGGGHGADEPHELAAAIERLEAAPAGLGRGTSVQGEGDDDGGGGRQGGEEAHHDLQGLLSLESAIGASPCSARHNAGDAPSVGSRIACHACGADAGVRAGERFAAGAGAAVARDADGSSRLVCSAACAAAVGWHVVIHLEAAS